MSNTPRRKVAVITGANAGIGYMLARRLIATHQNIRLCLACRNKEKATEAAACLEKLGTNAEISIVILDTSSARSVYSAAQDIRNRYDHIDLLYLNAGMMNVTGVNWNHFWQGLFSKRVFYMFTTGEGLLLHEDSVTEDGLQKVFESNVFGHYVLIKELEDRLGSVSGNNEAPSQLIWTSSSASLQYNFDLEDFQHIKGNDPYSSSKYATDVVSIGLNQKMNNQNVYSHSVCPGLVMTNLTYGILPAWFWAIMLPFLWLLRIFVPSMTSSTLNGTEALLSHILSGLMKVDQGLLSGCTMLGFICVPLTTMGITSIPHLVSQAAMKTIKLWLSHQDPNKLDPQTKYQSVVNMFGKAYVENYKMNIDPDIAEELIDKLDKLDAKLRKKYKPTN